MPRGCNCSDVRCGCVIMQGPGITVTGTGRPDDPTVISAEGGSTGGAGWEPGDVKWTARASAPSGWLVCDGSAVSRTVYAALFEAVGTAYGQGDGVTTFNLPDWTDKFMLGAGETYARGVSGGAAQVVLTTPQLPSHAHGINHDHGSFTTAVAGSHAHALDRSNATGATAANIPEGAATTAESNAQSMAQAGSHAHGVDVPAYAGQSGLTGQAQPVNIMPPYATALPLIKF